MLDKNGKIFGKLSVVDLIALVLLLLAIAAVSYRFFSGNAILTANNQKINYTVKISGVRDFTYPFYKPGLKCFDRQTNKYIGTIVNVRPMEPFFEPVEESDGYMRNHEKPGVIVIYLDIEANGSEGDTAYYAEGTYEIKAGSEIFLNTKYVDVVCRVTDVWAE